MTRPVPRRASPELAVALTTFATPTPLPAKHAATIRTADGTNGGAAEHQARSFAQAVA